MGRTAPFRAGTTLCRVCYVQDQRTELWLGKCAHQDRKRASRPYVNSPTLSATAAGVVRQGLEILVHTQASFSLSFESWLFQLAAVVQRGAESGWVLSRVRRSPQRT